MFYLEGVYLYFSLFFRSFYFYSVRFRVYLDIDLVFFWFDLFLGVLVSVFFFWKGIVLG